jgi:RimJ/RimL family protein N-acetyltransferase
MLPLMTPDREPFTPDAGPAPGVWPLFGLRLVAQDLDLRAVREHDAVALAALLPDDAELDPDNPLPGLGEGPEGRAATALQTMWRMWAGWTPQRWALPFAVRIRGELVGMQVLEGTGFAVLRTVDSASWLVPPARGCGTGRRMREAVLAFAFGTLGARHAITSAWSDNAASLGVSRSLGYVGNGVERHLRAGAPGGAGDMVHLRLSREDWRPPATGDVRVLGFEPCRPMFGLDPATPGA